MKRLLPLLLFVFTQIVAFSQSLRIFAVVGDEYHYLGRITSPYDTESIFNTYGKYGNAYNANSIWNEYGRYGNKYNYCSPWNEYSATPPVIVNNNNQIVGYFTTNEYRCLRGLEPMMQYIKENFARVAKDPSILYGMFFY